MPKQLKLEIKECVESLKKDLRKTITDMYRARIKMLVLIKSGKYSYQRELSNKLGYCERTINRWLNLYKKRRLYKLFTSQLQRKCAKEN